MCVCKKIYMRTNESKRRRRRRKKSSHMKQFRHTHFLRIAGEIRMKWIKCEANYIRFLDSDWTHLYILLHVLYIYTKSVYSISFECWLYFRRKIKPQWIQMKWKYFPNEIAVRHSWFVCAIVVSSKFLAKVKIMLLFLLLSHLPQVKFQA